MQYSFCSIAAILVNFFAVSTTTEAYYLSTNDVHQNPPDAFLAGENTPVWLAFANANGTVTYKRLDQNIVGSAVKSFLAARDESDESSGSFESDTSDSGSSETRSLMSSSSESQEALNSVAEKIKRDTHEHHHRRGKGHADTHRRKVPTYDTLHPSILVVTNYADTKTTLDETDFIEDVRNQLAFWNSVDLHYRDLIDPKVYIRIAGIVIGQGRSSQPYMEKFMNDSVFVSSPNGALQEMKKYWGEQASNPDFNRHGYDVIITVTDVILGGNEKHGHPLGLSAERSLCQDLSGKRYEAVGIVCDRMRFGGILTAVHELGHIFGAEHDTSLSGNCSKTTGYIMAASRSHTDHMHQWSPCSLDAMKKFLGHGKQCAMKPADYHNPGKPVPRIAPGDLLTADEQCEAFGFVRACHAPQPDMCTKLHCAKERPHGLLCQHVFTGAQDGTPCANNAICVHGECLEGNKIVQ